MSAGKSPIAAIGCDRIDDPLGDYTGPRGEWRRRVDAISKESFNKLACTDLSLEGNLEVDQKHVLSRVLRLRRRREAFVGRSDTRVARRSI